MRSTKLLALALTALLAIALAVPGVATAAKKKKGPVVVGTDADNDWGAEGGVPPEAAGAFGQELVEASIEMADPKTVNFIITVKELPPSGGMPEFTRYTWDFVVKGVNYSLDGKFTNYSRGACDPTSGQCDPTTGKMPRDPGSAPFMVRGECAPSDIPSFNACEEFGLVNAAFDAAAGTITIPVPLATFKGKPGTKIEPGVNITFGAGIAALPSAWVSTLTVPVYDLMFTTGTFVVPKK
jgi:hypothetical protein